MMMQRICLVVGSVASLAGGACSDPTPPQGSGEVLWRVESGAPELPLVPVANSDRSAIYFPTPDNHLKKIRGSDGRVLWDIVTGVRQVVIPGMNAVLSADVVAIARVDIFAFDTATGSKRWSYVAPGLEETGDGPLAADESTIFAGGLDGKVHAIDARTGIPRWVVNLASPGRKVAAMGPTVSLGVVFVCSIDRTGIPDVGTLWALDATTGAVKWSHQFAPLFQGGTSACSDCPAVWHDLVIHAERDGRVFAFDRATGAVRWTAPPVVITGQPGQDERLAAAGGNVVLVTSSSGVGGIVAYDAATGTERWRRTDFNGSLFLPALDSTTAYVDHGWIFASYELLTGIQRWATPPSVRGPATDYKGTAIIAGDRIFVAGRNASYALRR